jgi:gluconokinase
MVAGPGARGLDRGRGLTGPTPARAPRVILVMGVAGAGKTTAGRALAERLGGGFIEADDYHSEAAIERMRRGRPLDDEARWPWLRRVHAALVAAVREAREGRPVVVACSALKASYRAVLLDGFDDAEVVLLDVDRAQLDKRLHERSGHFMPPGLLDSQLADLEPPADAIRVDAMGDPGAVVAGILAALRVSG